MGILTLGGHWTDMGIITLVGTGQTWEFLL